MLLCLAPSCLPFWTQMKRWGGETLRATLYCPCPCLICEWRETRLDLQREGEQVPVWEKGHKGHCMVWKTKKVQKKKKNKKEERKPPPCHPPPRHHRPLLMQTESQNDSQAFALPLSLSRLFLSSLTTSGAGSLERESSGWVCCCLKWKIWLVGGRSFCRHWAFWVWGRPVKGHFQLSLCSSFW